MQIELRPVGVQAKEQGMHGKQLRQLPLTDHCADVIRYEPRFMQQGAARYCFQPTSLS